MKYRKFTIENYRAIKGPLEINLGRNSLIPIIGINESGKTTILHAIFSFDYFNDKLNENGRHLKDTKNLYGTTTNPATISAEVELPYEDFRDVLGLTERLLKKAGNLESFAKAIASYRRKKKADFPLILTIRRTLESGNYELIDSIFGNRDLNEHLCRAMVRHLPYILYFDDFRDSIEEVIEINEDEKASTSGWLSIIEQLFRQTDKTFSVFDLQAAEERLRKTILAKVERNLNSTLTKEWQNFRLDDTNALEISIEYHERLLGGDVKQPFLKLEVIETDANGDRHYFFIRDRSKGFYWFFNFVMKLEFNPKTLTSDGSDTIYLLDEPGSYLHASAQSKLCAKLKNLSSKNRVIYCTHSHYLLNPEVIPLNCICVADKNGRGEIELTSIHNHKGNINEKRSAFQPVIDALEIKPFVMDMTFDKVIITEGIYDYYALEMYKQDRNIGILPSTNADSVQYYISLMIAWQVPYFALWDNDETGRNARERAIAYFGEEEAKNRFFLLPLKGAKAQKRILQNLFDGEDITMIKRELGLARSTSFEKVMATLHYSANRPHVLNAISEATRKNFSEVFELLGL